MDVEDLIEGMFVELTGAVPAVTRIERGTMGEIIVVDRSKGSAQVLFDGERSPFWVPAHSLDVSERIHDPFHWIRW